MPNYNADMKINIGHENPIDYQASLKQLKDCETVVFVGGISPQLEGEEMPIEISGFKGGDRTNIELPKVQRNFLKALKEAGKKIVFVNCSGSAIALTPETESCDAILQAWYPGQEGGEAVITLDSRNFELFDAATNTVRAKAGKYEVYYGSSSADKDLKKLDISIEY